MKKLLIFVSIVILIVTIVIIVGVTTKDNSKDERNEILIGEIKSIESGKYLVLESEIGSFEIYYDNVDKFNVGETVKVTYDGSILDSLPRKISAISVELVSEKDKNGS